jgi:hypothetical protein
MAGCLRGGAGAESNAEIASNWPRTATAKIGDIAVVGVVRIMRIMSASRELKTPRHGSTEETGKILDHARSNSWMDGSIKDANPMHKWIEVAAESCDGYAPANLISRRTKNGVI